MRQQQCAGTRSYEHPLLRMTTEGWPQAITAPEAAPNVVIVVLDDAGFGHLGCYGGDNDTPNLDRLAATGLRYTNVHTTGLCSPSRACLLTGRNHHSCGMGMIPDLSTGHPGYNAMMPPTHGMLPEILRQAGYTTIAVGKWHLTATHEGSAAGPFDRWPLGRGFEHYYGFLGGETSQWTPALISGNRRIDPPVTDGYHLTEDLVNRAIQFVGEHRSAASEKPFFLYLCPAAVHAPHQAPIEFIDRYRGAFDDGWDAARERILARQKELGIMPGHVELPPRNPGVAAWVDLTNPERALYAAFNEAFAGFMTHTDHHLGRLFAFLNGMDCLDDTLTIVISDNGASGEAGPEGLLNELRFFNGISEPLADKLGYERLIGGSQSHNLYPEGWAMAGNTPFRFYKQYVFEGGVADPCIITWPAQIADRGGIRHQYHHLIDVMPTVLDAVGIDAPSDLLGFTQAPIDGQSMGYSFEDKEAPTTRTVQYYEMAGTRALWSRGWKVVSDHQPGAGTGDFDGDRWELYHTDIDPNELHDVADERPDAVAELVDLWWREAEANDVLPLDDRFVERWLEPRPIVGPSESCEYFAASGPIMETHALNVRNRPHSVRASVTWSAGTCGAILAIGSGFAGMCLFAVDGVLRYVYNYLGLASYEAKSRERLAEGPHEVGFDFTVDSNGARCVLVVDGVGVGECRVDQTCPNLFDHSPGLTVGRAFTEVSDLVVPPFRFTGELESVTIHAEHPGPTDIPAAARAAWAIQ